MVGVAIGVRSMVVTSIKSKQLPPPPRLLLLLLAVKQNPTTQVQQEETICCVCPTTFSPQRWSLFLGSKTTRWPVVLVHICKHIGERLTYTNHCHFTFRKIAPHWRKRWKEWHKIQELRPLFWERGIIKSKAVIWRFLLPRELLVDRMCRKRRLWSWVVLSSRNRFKEIVICNT